MHDILQYFESMHYAGVGVVGVIIGLVGLAYRDLTRRISHCEKDTGELIPMVTEIGADVKHIKEHCKRC